MWDVSHQEIFGWFEFDEIHLLMFQTFTQWHSKQIRKCMICSKNRSTWPLTLFWLHSDWNHRGGFFKVNRHRANTRKRSRRPLHLSATCRPAAVIHGSHLGSKSHHKSGCNKKWAVDLIWTQSAREVSLCVRDVGTTCTFMSSTHHLRPFF